MSTLKAKVVQIGNSKGIRIPKLLLGQCNIKNEIEIEVNGDTLILRPVQKKRKGWALAFKKMTTNKDDQLIDKDIDLQPTRWDREEWEWK